MEKVVSVKLAETVIFCGLLRSTVSVNKTLKQWIVFAVELFESCYFGINRTKKYFLKSLYSLHYSFSVNCTFIYRMTK